MEAIKTGVYGYVRLHGWRPKSISTSVRCVLGWTTALS